MHRKTDEHSGDGKRTDRKYKFALACGPVAMALSAPVIFRDEFLSSMEQARAVGYDAAELHMRLPGQLDAGIAKEYMERTGFEISAVATGLGFVLDKLSLISDDSLIRDGAMNRLREHIDLCAILDARVVIGSMRGNIPDFAQYGKYESFLLEGMNRLVDYASNKNVTILLEAINRYENNYLNSIEETLKVVETVNAPDLKIHIDTYHMNIEDADIQESVAMCGGRLGYIHFADSNRKHPGAGHFDFREVSKGLERAGYSGFLSIECLPGSDPRQTAEASLNFLQKFSSWSGEDRHAGHTAQQ